MLSAKSQLEHYIKMQAESILQVKERVIASVIPKDLIDVELKMKWLIDNHAKWVESYKHGLVAHESFYVKNQLVGTLTAQFVTTATGFIYPFPMFLYY